jgi:hypothetical protein
VLLRETEMGVGGLLLDWFGRMIPYVDFAYGIATVD